VLVTNVRNRSVVTYPWCYKHGVFTESELAQIGNLCLSLNSEPGLVGKNKERDTSIRSSDISWVVRNEDTAWFWDRIALEIQLLNEQFYGYELYGYDALQYSTYESESSGKYKFHSDISFGQEAPDESALRKLSASLLLNNDFTGGEFQIITGDPEEPVMPEMRSGTLIVFPSFMIHGVKTVTSGVRKSLVAWCIGPKFR
jgi:predicted 2-oxoglutarate/Fe(II)-dependent dioxygenase YbiX